MSLRISSLCFLALGLSACGAAVSPEPEGQEIECAIGPGAEFERVCTLERISQDQFAIHHPGGGFRRIRYDHDTSRIVTLSGSDGVEYQVSAEIDQSHVLIGGDRYLIPEVWIEPAPDE